MHLNYEVFYAKPGSTDDVQCQVCNSKCIVMRNVYGPNNFVAAIGQKYDYHDVFTCPNTAQEWHKKALKLIMAIQETPSKRLANLMKQDLEELLKENCIVL